MLSSTEGTTILDATVWLPKVDYNEKGKRNCAVDIEVKITAREQVGPVLSICGVIWNPLHTDCYSAGQNLEEIALLFPNNHKAQRLVEIWRRWHLNDMHAGCEHQRALGWGRSKLSDGRWSAHVYPNEHPDGVLAKPCPECGYRYGTAWLTEELPAEIINELKGLVA